MHFSILFFVRQTEFQLDFVYKFCNISTTVGCPKGSYPDGGHCTECPVGYYQDITNSQSCKQCPPNTNTTEAGAYNITQCQGILFVYILCNNLKKKTNLHLL